MKEGNEPLDFDLLMRLRSATHTKCVYLTDTCFYYDTGHGDGKNH